MSTLFKFCGEKSTVVNLDQVLSMVLAEDKITFTFFSSTLAVDFSNINEAQGCFDKIAEVWADKEE